MKIQLFFTVKSLPEEYRGEFEKHLEKLTSDIRYTCEYLSVPVLGRFDVECVRTGMLSKTYYEDQTLEDIQQIMDARGLKPCKVEIREQAYLDDNAIKPHRGIYKRGGSNAKVDSFIKSDVHTSYSIWNIFVHGDGLASCFSLYHLIRQNNVEPTEWWDNKPTETEKKES